MEQQNNCLALQALGSSMRSLLGPTPSIKCFVSGEPHSSCLLSDPLQILEALTSSETGLGRYGHPINHLLYECCQGQQTDCGCGVTTLICLSSFWSSGIFKLLNEEKVPLPAVFMLFDEAINLCSSLFTSLSVSMETIHSHLSKVPENQTPIKPPGGSGTRTVSQSNTQDKYSKVTRFSRHFSTRPVGVWDGPQTHLLEFIGSRLSHGKEVAMRLAVTAIEGQCSNGLSPLHLSSVLEDGVVGPPQSCSTVVCGVVVKVKEDMAGLILSHSHITRKHNILVVEGDCSPSSTHPGLQKRAHVTSHDPLLLYTESYSSRWLSLCSKVLEKLQIGIVVVGGTISPLLWEQCLATDVLVVSSVQSKQLQAICELSQATPIQYLQHATESHVGRGVLVSVMESGWTKSRVAHGNRDMGKCSNMNFSCVINTTMTANVSIVTALLCAKTESSVETLRHQFRNSLHRLNCALTTSLLPGGGVFEAACVRLLHEQIANKFPSSDHPRAQESMPWMMEPSLLADWRPAAYRTVADGLFQFSATVIANSNPEGMNGLQAAAEADRISQESCVRMLREVMDDSRSKKAAWRRSLEILKVTFCSFNVKQ